MLIVGAGFGGLFAAKALARADVEVTVIDRNNHHLFQPLLYQLATGILSEGDIAPPTRDVLRRQQNTSVRIGEVRAVDPPNRRVEVEALGIRTELEYDSLIIASGATQSYFGHPEFARDAPGMKSIDDALELRGRILGAFEMAESEPLPERACSTTPLGTSSGWESKFRLRTEVTGVDERGIDTNSGDPSLVRIEAATKVWAAGVEGSPLGRIVAEACGAHVDRTGRVRVNPDCTLPGHPEIFVIGDLMSLDDLPGLAQVAIQSGRFCAETIVRRLRGDTGERRFRYRDKGTMATISRFDAIAQSGPLRFSGFIGWVLWLAVHLFALTGFKNRFAVLSSWTIAFLGRGRSQRVITTQQVLARQSLRSRSDCSREAGAHSGDRPGS